MNYIRKKGSKVFHILGSDGSTRCFPGRYDTTNWEAVNPIEQDWQHICQNCLETPSKPEEYYPLRRKEVDEKYVVSQLVRESKQGRETKKKPTAATLAALRLAEDLRLNEEKSK